MGCSSSVAAYETCPAIKSKEDENNDVENKSAGAAVVYSENVVAPEPIVPAAAPAPDEQPTSINEQSLQVSNLRLICGNWELCTSFVGARYMSTHIAET